MWSTAAMPPLCERMIRKTIYLEPQQAEKLKRLARERGVTESQIVREAIDCMETEWQRNAISKLSERRHGRRTPHLNRSSSPTRSTRTASTDSATRRRRRRGRRR
ncbi:MAG TPA: CopG family transcriptional regulator [Thermoanaerobaculia bacterium]|nr:CopG family transcriptional regulator [Thermoanaerobaculia bacterium]